MGEIQTLGGPILDHIQSLVFDNLQVVSYKWLSRNFLVSSNAAKRLLQDFVDIKGTNIEVVYNLSGWLKSHPSVYHVKLVSRNKFGEAKQEFDDNCSVQVYSVQTCIPKDSASLWNAEFMQAEELFKQAPTVNNCLRDNRFCGVSNSYVKRNVEEEDVGSTAVLNKSSTPTVPGPSKSDSTHKTVSIPQPQPKKYQKLSPHFGQRSSNQAENENIDSHRTRAHTQDCKPATGEKRAAQLPVEKKNQQDNKVSSGTGGSLATMWGRLSTKSKSIGAQAETSNTNPNSSVKAAATVCAGKEVLEGSSDDNDQGINFKRKYNGEGSRKRRVFFDSSDDDDDFKDAVSLASPDLPKLESSSNFNLCSKGPSVEKGSLNFNGHKENKSEVKKDTDTKRESDHLLKKVAAVSESMRNGMPTSDKVISHRHSSESNACIKDEVTSAGLNSSKVLSKGNTENWLSSSNQIQNHVEEAAYTKNIKAASSSPKRRKVLKTRIDERGREVTKVVWEVDELEAKANSNTMLKASSNTVITNNRPPALKKSPAVGFVAPHPASKAGNRKAGKDPKQGMRVLIEQIIKSCSS